MPVVQVYEALGSFEFELLGNVPREVLDAIDWFGHVAIIPGRLDPRQYGDGCLDAARYVGVVRAKKLADDGRTNLIQDDIRISGVNMNFWLGDEEGNGPVIENLTDFTSGASFNTVITALRPTSVSNGTIHTVTGSYTGRHQYETARSAIQYVCETMSTEDIPLTYRVNNDGSLDAGPVADMYVTDPTCVIVRKNSISQGEDMFMRALPSTVDLDQDMENFTTRVVMLAEADSQSLATGSADIADVSPGTNVYKDIHGNTLAITKLVSESDTTVELADTRAELALRDLITPHRAFTIATDDYDIQGSFVVGDYVYMYDPDAGMVDTNNEIYIRGVRINPMKLQVTETDWPITVGYTVAYRDKEGIWTDLTDYVHWEETQPSQLVLGDLVRDLTVASGESVVDRVAGYVPSGTDGTTPDDPAFTTPFATSSYEDNTGNLKALVVVKWTEPKNTDLTTITDGNIYEISYRPVSETEWTVTTVGWATTSLLVTGLLPGTSYDFRIRASDSNANWGGYSSTHQMTTSSDPSIPDAPSAPSVSSDSAEDSAGVLKSFAAVSWSQPPNTDATPIVDGQSYEVQYKQNADSDWSSVTVPFDITSTTIMNLNPGVQYDFKVRAIDNAGHEGDFSSVTNETLASSASTPGAVTISSVNSDADEDSSGTLRATAVVTWSVPTNTDDSTIIDGSYYEVQNKTDSATAWSSQQVAFGTESTAVPVLLPNTDYNFRVRAVDNSGHVGAFGTTSNHTTAGSASIPAAPSTTPSGYATSSYEVAQVTRARILVTWSTPLNTDGTTIIDGGYYEVQFKLNGQDDWESRTVTWGTNELLISDLAPDVAYRFRMRAVDTSGNASAYTSEGTRTTGNVPSTPNAPSITIGTTEAYPDSNGTSKASQVITWTTPTNSDSSSITDGDRYEINLRLDGESNWAVYNVSWGTNSFQFNDLSVGTTYDVRIRAIDTGNNMSSFSTIKEFTTTVDTIAPSTPAAPSVAASTIAVQISHSLGKSSGGTFNLENDLSHLEVHQGSSSGFSTSSSTMIGTMQANYGALTSGVPVVKTFQVSETSAQYYKVIAVDLSGNTSSASTAASATALLIDNQYIDSLTASKITAGTLGANVVVGAKIHTASSGARVELDSSGINSYDASNNNLVSINSSDGLFSLKSGASGERIELDSSGLITYNSEGDVTSRLSADPTTTGDFISFRNTDSNPVASINAIGVGSFSTVNANTALYVGGDELYSDILSRYSKGTIAVTELTSDSPAYNGTAVEFGSIIIPNYDETRQYAIGVSSIRFDRQAQNPGPSYIGITTNYAWDTNASYSATGNVLKYYQQVVPKTHHGGTSSPNNGSDPSHTHDYTANQPSVDQSITWMHPFEFESAGGTDLHLSLFFLTDAPSSSGTRVQGLDSSRIYVMDLGLRVPLGSYNLGTGGGGTGPAQTYTKTYLPTWTGSYVENNSRRQANTFMYHGRYDATWGNQNGLIGFDYGQIKTDLTGATVQKIEWLSYSRHWYFSSGGTQLIGTHNHTETSSSPVTNSDANCNYSRVSVPNWPNPGWLSVELPTSWGAEFLNDTTRGIVLGPQSAVGHIHYGTTVGYDGGNSVPKLRITYTK